jgi:hypothetical protein
MGLKPHAMAIACHLALPICAHLCSSVAEFASPFVSIRADSWTHGI